ncbi:hypothetical protein A8A01_03600 [Ewingella americana]|nr:hypothetical protein A8A01_03600 [Ewingella americana]
MKKIKLLKTLASRGIAGISDCIILATLGLLFWFIFMSESEQKYLFAGISFLGFLIAYLVYRVADKFHDGV